MSDKWDAAEHTPSFVNQHRDRVYFDRILHSLFFESMGNREASIPKTYSKTFDWIFSDPPTPEDEPDKPLWSSFPEWLEKDSRQMYWITGKPGAGSPL